MPDGVPERGRGLGRKRHEGTEEAGSRRGLQEPRCVDAGSLLRVGAAPADGEQRGDGRGVCWDLCSLLCSCDSPHEVLICEASSPGPARPRLGSPLPWVTVSLLGGRL